MKDLPAFRERPRDQVMTLVHRVLMLDSHSDHSYLHQLVSHADGHYHVLFDPAYFVLQAGQTEPSKSQWSSLKKKFKRHDPSVFVFKEHGFQTDKDKTYAFLDFGFFAQ
ncbi:MAG: hypothetical protein GC179_23635 [Anaerolineaceae bacterium]|nr:hypothetical protein [Anaerolineaceae bacterium]